MAWQSLPVFVGIDSGPCETLMPIAKHWGLAPESATTDDAEFWIRRIAQSATMVVTGTSDSAKGRAIEAAARAAARLAGVPVAAIEDYPGNYPAVAGAHADLLLVESDAATTLARSRLGEQCPPLKAISPARFDAMRLNSASARIATGTRWRAGEACQEPPAMLWIGQPETDDSLATLEELLPAARDGNWRLLFRAHPRDAGYAMGAYAWIARELGSRFLDVTELDANDVFAAAPRLVLTQFSSMVVQAGFHGIPSLCMLFPGVGMERHFFKKGYRIPLACTAGAIGLCTEPARLQEVLHRLLENEPARSELLTRFDDYFKSATTTTAASVTALKTLLEQGI